MSNVAQNHLLLNSKIGETDLTAIIKNIARKADVGGLCVMAPGIASRVVDEMNFHGQRRVKKARVAENLKLMRDGGWEPHVSTLVFCELPDGSLTLINGQHRCCAIVELGAPLKTKIDIIPLLDALARIGAELDLEEAA